MQLSFTGTSIAGDAPVQDSPTTPSSSDAPTQSTLPDRDLHAFSRLSTGADLFSPTTSAAATRLAETSRVATAYMALDALATPPGLRHVGTDFSAEEDDIDNVAPTETPPPPPRTSLNAARKAYRESLVYSRASDVLQSLEDAPPAVADVMDEPTDAPYVMPTADSDGDVDAPCLPSAATTGDDCDREAELAAPVDSMVDDASILPHIPDLEEGVEDIVPDATHSPAREALPSVNGEMLDNSDPRATTAPEVSEGSDSASSRESESPFDLAAFEATATSSRRFFQPFATPSIAGASPCFPTAALPFTKPSHESSRAPFIAAAAAPVPVPTDSDDDTDKVDHSADVSCVQEDDLSADDSDDVAQAANDDESSDESQRASSVDSTGSNVLAVATLKRPRSPTTYHVDTQRPHPQPLPRSAQGPMPIPTAWATPPLMPPVASPLPTLPSPAFFDCISREPSRAASAFGERTATSVSTPIVPAESTLPLPRRTPSLSPPPPPRFYVAPIQAAQPLPEPSRTAALRSASDSVCTPASHAAMPGTREVVSRPATGLGSQPSRGWVSALSPSLPAAPLREPRRADAARPQTHLDATTSTTWDYNAERAAAGAFESLADRVQQRHAQLPTVNYSLWETLPDPAPQQQRAARGRYSAATQTPPALPRRR
jgi:hypothetical protein